MEQEEIIARISGLYPAAIIDVAGQDCNFEVYVISENFAGMKTLQRQQSILGLFQPELSTGKLHALTVKAKTPEEQNMNTGFVQIQL